MTVKMITCKHLREWGACYYSEGESPADVDARMRQWAGGRDAVTPLEALDLADVSVEDRIWLALQPGVLSDRHLRHLTCDFAEHTLHIFERAHPDDARPRETIAVARRYADGAATAAELAAARAAAAAGDASAAWDAAAAWAAAEDAAAARATSAALAAARAAAWAAAGAVAVAVAAAWAAAEAAAWAAERRWQLDRCRYYLRLQARGVR